MAQSNKRTIIALALVGAVVVVGGVAYLKFRPKDEEEDLTFDTTKSPKAEQPPAVIDNSDNETGARGDYKHFPEYGLALQLPPHWEAVVDDFSMMGPHIAVIRIHPPGYEHSVAGELPSLSVIVEDVGREQMTLLAYKEKSKEYAMSMAGGGGLSVMSAPEITKDASVAIGPFQHTLEYIQMFPTVQAGSHMPYKFMNLMTLHKGLAYVLQYMARNDRFRDHYDTATAIAETLLIRDLPHRPASRLEFVSQPHSLKVTVPETWTWVRENKDMGDGRTLVVSFLSGSSNKPDSMSLYTLSKAASSPKALAEKYRDVIGASGEVTLMEGDIAHFSYNADGKLVAVYCKKDCVLECRPEGERVTHHSQEDAVIVAVLRSVTSQKGVSRSHCRYHNVNSRIGFEVSAQGKLLEHKWGTTCVTYIPVSEDQDHNVPVFSVEVNVEDEVYADLQAVEAKIMAGSDPNTPLKDKQIESYGGRDFLTFQLSRDEQLPWGQSEEYRSKILLALRGQESIMLKWEVAAQDWSRYERHLTSLLHSLEILP